MRLSYAEIVSENPLEFFENRFANEKLVLREHEFQDVMTESAGREGRDQDIGVQCRRCFYGDYTVTRDRSSQRLRVSVETTSKRDSWRPAAQSGPQHKVGRPADVFVRCLPLVNQGGPNGKSRLDYSSPGAAGVR